MARTTTVHPVKSRMEVLHTIQGITVDGSGKLADMIWNTLQYFREITIKEQSGERHTFKITSR